MSALCFGSFGTLLIELKATDFNKIGLVDFLIGAILSKTEVGGIDNSDKYKLLKCEIDIENIRSTAGTNAVCDTINNYFTEKGTRHLKPALYDDLKIKLRDLIIGDDTIARTTKEKFLISLNNDDMVIALANIFNYACTKGNIHTDPFANSGISSEQFAEFKATLNSATFDNVFLPIPHEETLGLVNPNHIKIFHLNIEDNAFSFSGLHNFLQKNVGRYIFSRSQIEKFHIDGEEETIGAKAIGLIKDKQFDNAQLGNELGDIMLYIFLEQVLKAPKIYNKIEIPITATNVVANQGGVHLLTISEAETKYQMVFGKSSIINSISEAINNAFIALANTKKNLNKEYQLLETSVLSQSFDSATSEYLKNIIIPQNAPQTLHRDNAYGVFLGYKIDIDASKYNNDQFRTAVKDKMVADIQAQIPYIINKIKVAKMETSSFYIYLLPFNNADDEKTEIMKVLLNGGVV
jgi:hypothetical protein